MRFFFRHSRKRDTQTQSCAVGVGEHVWVDGREGEFVVLGVDQKHQTLQLLPVGQVGRLETLPAASVRAVLPPKPQSSKSEEIEYGGPTAA